MKFLADLGNGLGTIAKVRRRGSRYHLQVTDGREIGEELVLDTIAKIRVVLAVAHAGERRVYRDRER